VPMVDLTFFHDPDMINILQGLRKGFEDSAGRKGKNELSSELEVSWI